jgi:hypothetical protein
MVAKKVRREGTPSDLLPPPDAPSWAVKDQPRIAGIQHNVASSPGSPLALSPGHPTFSMLHAEKREGLVDFVV